MNLEEILQVLRIPVLVIALVIFILFLLARMWKKIPQDKAAVITGLRKRVITGGGGFVIPGLERMDCISLGNMPLNVQTTGSLSSQGVPISVTTTAVLKVNNDRDSILTAIEQFVGRSEQAIAENIVNTATSVLEGKLREIIATMTVEDLYNKREDFSSQVQEVVGTEFATMGLFVKAFTICDISDEQGYIDAMGAGRIAEKLRDANVAKAEAAKEEQVKTSEARKEGESARLEADASIAEAAKKKGVREATYRSEQERANAQAELAHEIQLNITKKEVISAQKDAELLANQRQKEVAEAEIQVQITQAQKNTELNEQKAMQREKELLSEVVRPAEAARKKQEQEAEAAKYNAVKAAEAEAERKKIDALAEAEAIRAKALAEAEAIRAKASAEAEAVSKKGKAEAEAIQARLSAEADGLEKKAVALTRLNEAGKLQMVVDALPEMARAIAEPLTSIDKVTIIDGGGSGSGVDAIGGYVPSVLAKTIEAVRETTGFDMVDTLKADTIQAKVKKEVLLDGELDMGKNRN